VTYPVLAYSVNVLVSCALLNSFSFTCCCVWIYWNAVQCFLPDSNTSAVDHSVFGRVWQQYLTVPLLLVVILFPLINCKSPTFFTKLNSLGRFCTLFIVLLCLHPSYSWAGGIMFPGCLSLCVWMHTYLCMCQCMPGQRNSLTGSPATSR